MAGNAGSLILSPRPRKVARRILSFFFFSHSGWKDYEYDCMKNDHLIRDRSFGFFSSASKWVLCWLLDAR